jgi:hypothetical protein
VVTEKSPLQIGVNYFVPFPGWRFRNELGATPFGPEDSGRVYQYVNLAEARYGLSHHLLHILFLPHIEGQSYDPF